MKEKEKHFLLTEESIVRISIFIQDRAEYARNTRNFNRLQSEAIKKMILEYAKEIEDA